MKRQRRPCETGACGDFVLVPGRCGKGKIRHLSRQVSVADALKVASCPSAATLSQAGTVSAPPDARNVSTLRAL
ncbi:hypothetical protein [Roseovarius spongiae]|uniref:hypothetical protein n=1 Tax=Roseovarius spongiae TaxID=2320272 RepID=UPI001408959A|nr:hypothetical protein [Roseovarius spongiae]